MLSKTHQNKFTLMKREMGKDGDQGESSNSQRTTREVHLLLKHHYQDHYVQKCV